MFERFTKRARAALVQAKVEAYLLRHNFIGTEHLLLGLLSEEEGVAARVLIAEGLTFDRARREVVRIIGRGPVDSPTAVSDAEALASIGIDLDAITEVIEGAFGEGALDRARGKRRVGTPRFTPRAKKMLELSLREALTLGHNYIGTEHLLLAIVRLKEGVAYDIVAAAVAEPESLRQKVLDELRRLRPGA